jgi:hypothetical protein
MPVGDISHFNPIRSMSTTVMIMIMTGQMSPGGPYYKAMPPSVVALVMRMGVKGGIQF